MRFLEAFEGLQVPERLDAIFEDVSVERVVASHSKRLVQIHICSNRLIPHKEIGRMEYQLQRQLFTDLPNRVKLVEHYRLSAQYTPENLYHAYFSSLVEELSAKSVLDGNLLQHTQADFEGGTLTLTFGDSFITRNRAPQIGEWLKELYQERFAMDLAVSYVYQEIPERKEEETEHFAVAQSAIGQGASGTLAVTAVKGNTGSDTITASNVSASSGTVASSADTRKKVSVSSGNINEGASAEAATGSGSDRGTALSASKGATQPAKKKSMFSVYQGSGGTGGSGKDGQRAYRRKLPDDPDVFYGKAFEGETKPISELNDGSGEVIVQGQVLKVEEKETRTGKILFTFAVTDFTDSIGSKIFARDEDEAGRVREKLKKGAFIRLKGVASWDNYSRELSLGFLVGIKTIPDFTNKRMDTSEKKRVELHLHTLMSDMDAVVNVKSLFQTLKSWGHRAVAITDHGVVQAFTEASHALSKGDDFKVIYGMEAYLVDDVSDIVQNDKGQRLSDTAVVFDIETTGFGPGSDHIIEIGAVKVREGEIVEHFSSFLNPQVPIPLEIEKLTGITDEMVLSAPTVEVVLPQFLAFCEGAVLVAHNAAFDTSFIRAKAAALQIKTDFTVVDTVGMARVLLPDLKNHKLDTVAAACGVSLENHHRAVDDAGATAEIYLSLCRKLAEQGVETLEQLNENSKLPKELIKKLPTYHTILLAKNDVGRINLYKLVSLSHLEYFARRPRIPKSLLMENREGLIVGSACEAGELYRAILNKHGKEEIGRLARFYDYFEIQPLGNNHFMIESAKIPDVNSDEDLIAINKEIVALGEEYQKPVVATCDVHFLNPEDEAYRRMIMNSKGFEDADRQPPLYLRTTEEMLAEFSYLGAEKAEEVVITNTNKIADMVERISPVRPDKCPPIIENSAETLRKICYDKAYSMYGDPLPEPVKERLEHELKSIIGNGFAVMYIIAQKLVWKSNEDGYLVGSRGSVGSSFVAAMAGITEVNSLPAHYYCESCHYSDFDSEEVKAFGGRSGCDMPDKLCPVCGQPLIKDGHDIPFETFLGFYGDKEPDIDLNFSGEYQAKAHAYTEVIFGEGQTFRAGTIGTVADKTAYGYVLRYNEEHQIEGMRSAEIERISQGCVGVRRTTGQHPGGIVVLPIGEEIYSFTPVQHPANDMNTPIVTTHFDYHSIDHNLLKLDILGHDDPTMIRMLEDITGKDAKSIQLDDEKVLSLFNGLSALGITAEDLDGTDLGSLGIPEFGTEFVMQMLRETKPKSFSELVRISGLSHGTDVWTGNAQVLVQEGTCTLSTAICTRDDIMIYLIQKGVEAGKAFKIMESVRKGKGLTEEMETAMKACDVPDWYIWSCKKIQYMFPKAHAAAYVMMGFRIAWFKVYEPLAYYAAFFSIRATAFDYEKMCQGRAHLDAEINLIKKKGNEATNKEQDMLRDMKIVQEMYARGFGFHKIALYQAQAKHFQILDGKLMPSFNSIDGMGDKAAMGIVDAIKDGPFLSKDDLKQRAKVSQTTVDTMSRLGLLDGLPESNQISLLDFFGVEET